MSSNAARNLANLYISINSTNGSATVTTATGTLIPTTNGTSSWVSSPVGTTTAGNTMVTLPLQAPTAQIIDRLPDHIKLMNGKGRHISFPDGTEIYFNADGSFEIDDKNAKVIYKASRVREFNPFLNASDKLEDFIKFCGSVGVRQGDMLSIPIQQFVQWLVIEAARADGEEVPGLLLPKPQKARCLTCGRFISPKLKENRMEFCRPSCFEVRYRQFHKEQHHEVSNRNSIDSVAISRTS